MPTLAEHNLLLLGAVPLAGVLAGFINTLAGNGSLITLPILILLGLPANVANGTNRVGILVQNIVAVAIFRRHGTLQVTANRVVLISSVLGALLGAQLAVDIDEALLRRVIGTLMLVMLVVIVFRPRRWLERHEPGRAARWWIQCPIFFAIGAYGGFVMAGVGFFLIAGLVLAGGQSLVSASAAKNFVVLVFTIGALAVFVLHDQVRWDLGLLLAGGNAAGAWIAARLAVARGAAFVRYALIAILALATVALLGDFRIG